MMKETLRRILESIVVLKDPAPIPGYDDLKKLIEAVRRRI